MIKVTDMKDNENDDDDFDFLLRQSFERNNKKQTIIKKIEK